MTPSRRSASTALLRVFALFAAAAFAPCASAADVRSHPPMRPGPAFAKDALTSGPKFFVDATKGDDSADGGERSPWKSLARALRQLRPGDTLYLRGGVRYEKCALSRSGTAESPITVASYPGETAILDGSLREFTESPATAWEPLADGADGEFVSTRTYFHADTRRVPGQFLPSAWEPMWGIEDQRPLALGFFADSMVPLHGCRTHDDLRATNELFPKGKQAVPTPVWCGPSLWFNRDTGRIHVRLAHHRLDGLGDRAYRGATDPRTLPLVVAAGFGEEALRLTGVKHVRLRNLVFRGATGSPMISIYGCENVELDHVTIHGGNPALLVNASRNVRVLHSAFRGNAAPWTGRAHMKYRGTASYQIVLRDDQPVNEDIEFGWCEFTDDHDFAFLRFAKNLRLHHCFVDNFNDDGLECGPKRRDHTLFIHENRIGAILSPFTQHEMDRDEAPADHDPKCGVFIFRNVIDLRAGVYYQVPAEPDPTGAFLRHEGHLAADHGGPIWPVMRWYHNTVIRRTPTYRDYFLLGLGAQGLGRTERDVFNNIFVQLDRAPGAGFAGIREAGALREGGNILFGANAPAPADPFAKFRASPFFAASRKFYEPGWTTHDRVVDPGFAAFPADLRLKAGGAAVDGGLDLPGEWPDPLRAHDAGRPDVGALPLGANPWGVGVEGRVPLASP